MSSVFIIHNGNQAYLRQCVRFSHKCGNDTLLIGSESSFSSSPESFYSDQIVLPHFEEFKRHYRHMSSNSYHFEIVCFRRFFLLAEFASRLRKNAFWLIDSDLLLLNNLSEAESFLTRNSYDCALSSPRQIGYMWVSSPHLSFWTTAALNEFIDFVIKTYRDNFSKLEQKWNYHLAHGSNGGICDMTLLYLWQSYGKHNIYNLAQSHIETGVFHDHNINVSANYGGDFFSTVPFLGLKKVVLKGGRYTISTSNRSSNFLVGSLHFQGSAKSYMPFFEKHSGTASQLFLLSVLMHKIAMLIRSKMEIVLRLKGLSKLLKLLRV